MLIKRPADIKYSEVTPENLYHNRREFLRTASASLGVAAAGMILPGCVNAASSQPAQAKAKGPYDTTEKATPYEDITSYNNFYEFGVDKGDPAANSKNFKTAAVDGVVEGMVKKPMKWALDDLIKGIPVEDRLYRMRCVEAWSMVIPWNGVPLAEVIKRLEPIPGAQTRRLQDTVRSEADAWPAGCSC